MKKILFLTGLLYAALTSMAQVKVETINLNGRDYTVTATIPDQYKGILGRYTYEWGKNSEEPIIELNANNTGLFQPHDVPAIPIKFWIDCDENGVIRKQEGVNGRYQLTLLIQYGPGSRIYPEGTYNLMGVAVVVDKGYAVIYGERYKKI